MDQTAQDTPLKLGAETNVPGLPGALSQAAGGDRRGHKRFSVEGWAEIVVVDRPLLFRGEIADISAAGCYITTRAELEFRPGTMVEMIFRVKGEEFRPKASTRVVKPGHGAGFLFVSLTPKLEAQLGWLIELLSSAETA